MTEKALSKEKKNVVGLCESPLQLLNIIEYALINNCNGIVIIRLNQNEETSRQIDEVLKFNKLLVPFKFSLAPREYNLGKYILLIIKYLKILMNADYLLIGDIRSSWIRMLASCSGGTRTHGSMMTAVTMLFNRAKYEPYYL